MKSSELLRVIKKASWLTYVRQTDNHYIFRNENTGKNFPVPFHGAKEIPTGTLKSILKDAGLKK